MVEFRNDLTDGSQDVDRRLAVGVDDVGLVQERSVTGFASAVGVQGHSDDLVFLRHDGSRQRSGPVFLSNESLCTHVRVTRQ